MALFYVGPRPVLKGRNANDDIDTYNGRHSVYSNYQLFNPSHIFDGAPNTNHVPGTGRHPHGLKLSRVFTGLENDEQPLRASGLGARQTYDGRFNPTLFKGLTDDQVLHGSYGHGVGSPIRNVLAVYTFPLWTYRGVGTEKSEPLKTFGHAIRYVDASGTAFSFGDFGPNDPGSKNVGKDPLEDSGHALPATADSDPYGFARINEWRGVPSAQALGSNVNG